MARPRKIPHFTISDIARELSLSAGTVSKALGDYPEISADTRQRVRETCRARGFTPSSVRRDRTQLAVLTDFDPTRREEFSGWMSRFVGGFSRYCGTGGLDFSLLNLEVGYLDRIDIVRELKLRKINGVALLIQSDAHERIGKDLARQLFPHVHAYWGDRNRLVGVDDRTVGHAAAEHLFANGYRKFAALMADHDRGSAYNPSVERLEGFREWLAAAGVQDVEVIPALASDRDGFGQGAAAGNRLARVPRSGPMGLFAMSNQIGIALARSLRDAGADVPRDFGVIACDDHPFFDWTDPALSTVAILHDKIGEAAAENLRFLLGDAMHKVFLRVAPELRCRASTMARPGSPAAGSEPASI